MINLFCILYFKKYTFIPFKISFIVLILESWILSFLVWSCLLLLVMYEFIGTNTAIVTKPAKAAITFNLIDMIKMHTIMLSAHDQTY